jgi:hypothetical protein
MHILCIYRIELYGRLSEETVNAKSPLQMIAEQSNAGVTRFTVHADQAGLVGLIRHLHSRGYVLLSVSRVAQ